MTDEIRERLARLDPMNSDVPTEPTTSESSRKLLEDIMSTPIKERTETKPGRPRQWTIGIAAASALVLAVAAGLALNGAGGEAPTVAGPALELTAGGEDIMMSCIAFDTTELERVAEIAFEGTVTSVDGETITLEVDTWYRGADNTRVILHAPHGLEALIGGIPFVTGEQYLISAQGGSVNYCGFSGVSTPEYRAAFETAFAQG